MLEAPAPARLVEDFANTVDVELGTDDLAEIADLAPWLRSHGLLDRARRVTAADHALALGLRTGIREELGVHVGDDADPDLVDGAARSLRELPVLIRVGAGGEGAAGGVLAPAPELPPVRQALARIAIAWSELAVTGEASRLKRCAEHSCALVFWDTSKNRSRRWCSMRVCGNRAKSRRYTAKRTRGAESSGGESAAP
ncbi:CGNR zinc finger [Streptomyces sp. YIM 130001]|uniref:CGNR zinc finger domain-containing protein n=1 Tax=Streptomyces sp. YIM 130001 TaxID=2259644 RepID=UPI000E64FDF0|nr:CGNR zinc finger domain-containing protein [Streptomyces sp. YIM 130001]RII21090.1 CGNR zinc finger [Streptomyces sp. YIM 130001]